MDPRTYLPLPVTGPGSQSDPDGSPALDYLPIPTTMDGYRRPDLPEPETAAGCAAALALMDAALAALAGPLPVVLGLDHLDATARSFLGRALGDGEVSLRREAVGGRCAARAQETALAGVWIVQSLPADGGSGSEALEIAAAPSIAFGVWSGAGEQPARVAPGADVMNAPAVLTELEHRRQHFDPAAPAHVTNLSLLPFTPADHDWLGANLGRGPLTVLSRGYGNCRLAACALPNLWRVQYFNSMDTLILDTVELTALPEIVCAAPEDLADSRERLAEIRALYA